jgi:hypothetical protein
MPAKRIGNIQVNGFNRQIQTQGNPLGRVMIQVDGITVYNKWNLLQNKVFNFEVVPGKPASLRWSRIANQIEYVVTVDGKTTHLSPEPETAADTQDSKKRERWIGVGACLAVSAISFGMNYQARMEDGSYYPGYLGLIPTFLLAGLLSLFRPDWKEAQNSKVGQVIAGAIVLATMAFGYTYFTHWFLQTFKYIPPYLSNDY